MENQKNKIVLYTVLSSLITAIIIGGLVFLWQNSILKTTKSKLNTEIQKFQNQIAQLQEQNNIKTETQNQQTESALEKKSYFQNLPDKLQKKDNTVKITPSNGFFSTTSILSNKKDKIVYSEISESIKNLEDYGSNWEYNIFVKDLSTDEVVKIYSYPEKVSLKDFFVKTVNAGGCPLVYFPIAWSKNDAKIILEWGNPTSCGSGGAPKYQSYTINPGGGEIIGLSTYDSIFFNNYSKVVFVDASGKSPSYCGPVSQDNNGAIILKDIENESEVLLAEENNSSYSLKNIDENQNLTYTVKKVIEVNGCGELDASTPEEIKTLKIK